MPCVWSQTFSLVPQLSFIVANYFHFHVGFFLSGKFQCPPTRAFRCQNDRVCLQVSKRCDGVNNCGDNSDELNCRRRPSCFCEICTFLSCKRNVECASTESLPAVLTCEKDEFLCANHRCISSTLRCNLFNDCEDFGSDEIGCKTGQRFQKRALMGRLRFKGFIGFSFSDAKLNDCRSNRTHCGDGDEAHCITNGTDSFCSCKPGFQKIGHRTCGGTSAHQRSPVRTMSGGRVPVGSRSLPLCLDKNECLRFGVCSHSCNNTKGSYKCSCHKYFTRISDTCKADSEDRPSDAF